MIEKDDIKYYFDKLSDDYLKYKYLRENRSFMSVRMEKIVSFLDRYNGDFSSGERVLDAGCGPGSTLNVLARKGYRVTGLDRSGKMLELASRQLAGLDNWDLVEGDIEALPFDDNSFDIVLSAGVIEYLESDEKVLLEFKRVLKNDGLLLIPVTNRYSYTLLLDGCLEMLMKPPVLFSAINYINKKILKRGDLQPKQFPIRKHSPYAFRDALIKKKFNVIDSSFFYFMPLPHPFNWLCSSLSNKVGSAMEGLGSTGLGILGEGYLMLCRNDK